MATKLDPIPLAPAQSGISKRASKLSIGDRWTDSDKVRFVDGKPQKIGGFTKKTVNSITNPIRGTLAWATMQLVQFIGIGTHRKLYVADQTLDPQDITPVESTGTLNNPFTVTQGSSSVLVHHVAHNRGVGDEVRFSGTSQFSGVTIVGTYPVASVQDEDNYLVEHTETAIIDGTGGGTVTYEYELSIGASDPLEGDGYGAGGYGLGDYGAPSDAGSGSIIFEPRVWSLAKYGDLLLANPVNGSIYQFDPAATPAYQRATILLNAPTVCRSMFVTPERFLFALGVDNDPMNIKWPDQDDITNWTPGSTTTANSRRLQEGTRIIGGKGVANLLSGVWTDTALYQFQYTGSSFIYDSKCVGTNCGLVSPMALVVHLNVAYWMSQHGFHYWAGGAPQSIPNSEEVREYVITALRASGYEFKCNAHLNTRFNELWFFYVPVGSTEPGLYVAVSLLDYNWVVGTMERTSGTFYPSSDQRPILASADGWLYQHEEGLDADGEIMKAFISRAPMQIASGAKLGEIEGFVNDMERQVGTMSIEAKMYDRIDDGVIETGREFFETRPGVVDFRVGGRIAEFTLRSESLGGDFRLGAPSLIVNATGSRR